jgi:2-polyprenyl-3-methyl-5-hydroxy-6-metoxy-1,4-benzoquinol methylase
MKELYMVNNFTIVKCKNCTLHFVRDIINDEYLKNFYAQMPTKNEHRVYFEKSNEKNLQYAHATVAKKIKKHFNFQNNLNILDLGCSNGSFLEQFSNWNVYGIELEETTGKIAQSKHKNIFIGDMKDANFGQNFFDCITINDALDHSNNPNFVIEHCYSLLKSNGIIVIKVHNINCLLAKLTGKKFYAICPPAHLTYFNLKTLCLLLEKNNFKFNGYFYNAQKLRLDTMFLRASMTFPWLKSIEKILNRTIFGAIPFYKNFHDIITVIGVKK